MENETKEFFYECKDSEKTYWTEKCEVWFFTGRVAFVRYYFKRGETWSKQTKRKGTLKVYTDKKGSFIKYQNRKCYL